MSVVTVRPGVSVVLDPADVRIVQFDWDADNLATAVTISTSTYTITSIRQTGGTALTKDNPSILAGNRKTQIRLIATTATEGDIYELSNTIVTNESPTQTKTQSTPVLVQQR